MIKEKYKNLSGQRWVYFLSYFDRVHNLYTSLSTFEFAFCLYLLPVTNGFAFEWSLSALLIWGKWYTDDIDI